MSKSKEPTIMSLSEKKERDTMKELSKDYGDALGYKGVRITVRWESHSQSGVQVPSPPPENNKCINCGYNPATTINKEWFKPSELAKDNLITNSKGKGDYRHVLKLIKNGKLKARDWSSTGNKPYWLVHWTEITNYNNEMAYETMSKWHSLQLSPPMKILETGIVIISKPKYIPTRLWKYLVRKVTTKRDLELITND